MSVTGIKKKILLKLSGEALADPTGDVYEYKKLDILLQKISDLAKRVELSIVLWWGNIWRYKDNISSGIERVTSDYIGMTATLINAIVIAEKLAHLGHVTRVYAPATMQIANCTHVYNVGLAREAMADGNIVFCAWGTWNPYCTTDSAAVLRALELNCDLMIKATKVDGIYTDDPVRVPGAKKYDILTLQEATRLHLNVMDHPAFAMAADERLPLRICNIEDIDLCGQSGKWTRVLPEHVSQNDFSLS